jgi:FkbM family methyltransferase
MSLGGVLRPLRQRLRAGVRSAVHALSEAPYGTSLLNRGMQAFGARFQEHVFLLSHAQPVPARAASWQVRREDFTIRVPIADRWPLSWQVGLSAYVHERGIQRFCARFRELGDSSRVIIDVGANHGLFSFPFMVHGYRCALFEPQRACLDYVAAAVALNPGARAPELVCVVLAEEAGAMTFYTSASTFYSSLERSAVEQWEPAVAITVPTYRLDDYVVEHGLVPALIKIDVEGGELRVLDGARELLARHRPSVVIELHANSGHRAQVHRMLHALDYDVSALPDDLRLAPLTYEQFLADESANFAFVHERAQKALLRAG